MTIEYMKNPEEQICLLAVTASWNALKYIKNPSKDVMEKALAMKGWAIQYIKDPSEDLEIKAVQTDCDAIKYIKNPTEKTQIEAVKNYWSVIKFIEEPYLNTKIEAVRQNEEAIRYIDAVEDHEVKALLKGNLKILKYIYDDVEENLIEEVLIEKMSCEEPDKTYIKDFLNLEVLVMNKLAFINEYGSKKVKQSVMDYTLSL